MKRDVIVIGAGASGLLCAIEAAKKGRSVLVLDRAAKVCSKLRMSGGGRCNFTNRSVGHENYVSDNPHFCKSALARFTPGDFVSLIEKYSIPFIEKEQGRLFCKKSSMDIVKMLLGEVEKAGVEIQLNCGVLQIRKNGLFKTGTRRGIFLSESVVLATGGLSYPELGASDIGHRIAREFGIAVTSLRPALVPLVLNKKERPFFSELSGISFDARVSCNKKTFKGNILFTHKGLSGPAVLQISLYWKKGNPVVIDLLPGKDILGLLLSKHQTGTELKNLLSGLLTRRFIHKWCEIYFPSRPMRNYSTKELENVSSLLHCWKIIPEDTEGFGKAEVTLGGIDTDELSSRTMESKKVPGLFFIGEVVDVTGQLGGYNLHWAWASGHAAGQYA